VRGEDGAGGRRPSCQLSYQVARADPVTGRLQRKPWARWTPNRTRARATCGVSTPSAIVRNCMSWASATTDRTIAASLRSAVMPVTKLRSIFTVSTGSCLSLPNEDQPVPKSSTEILVPKSWIRRGAATADSLASVLSVTSKRIIQGGIPDPTTLSIRYDA